MKEVKRISLSELRLMAEKSYIELVKANVDVARRILVVDAELHADIEAYMIDNGSRQEEIWGVNLYPKDYGTNDFIEFDSMINIRPSQKNQSRYVQDENIRGLIVEIVNEVVYED